MAIDVQALSRLRQQVSDSRSTVNRAMEALALVQTDLAIEAKANPEPTIIVGMVKDFRFRGGDAGQRPRYTFKVDSNTGLIHWVSCSTTRLDTLIRDIKVGSNLPKAMNGKLIRLGRRVESKELQPMKMLGVPLDRKTFANDVPSGYDGFITDKYDRWLYIGATVMDENDMLLGTIDAGPLSVEDCANRTIYINFFESDELVGKRVSTNLIRVDAT